MRKNAGLEAAGSVSEVVTGKTNTLTTGDMEVATLHIGTYTHEGVAERKEGGAFGGEIEMHMGLFENLKLCVLLNTDARMEMADVGEDGAPPEYKPSGSPVEVGLFRWLIK